MAVVVSHNNNLIEGLMSLLKHNGYKQLDHYRQELKLLLITSVLRPIREVLRHPSNRNKNATNYEKMKDKPLTKSVCNAKQYTLYAELLTKASNSIPAEHFKSAAARAGKISKKIKADEKVERKARKANSEHRLSEILSHCDGSNSLHCEGGESDGHARLYLCTWEDHDSTHDTWETFRNLTRGWAARDLHSDMIYNYCESIELSSDSELSSASSSDSDSTVTETDEEDDDDNEDVTSTDASDDDSSDSDGDSDQ